MALPSGSHSVVPAISLTVERTALQAREQVIDVTTVIVAGALLGVVVALGLIGDGSLDFYELQVRNAAHDRDRLRQRRAAGSGYLQAESRGPRSRARLAAHPIARPGATETSSANPPLSNG